MTRTILLAFAALILPAGTANAQDLSAEIDLLEMHIGSGDDHFVFDGELQIGGERHAATFKLDGGSDVGPRIDEVTAQALYTFRPRENLSFMTGVRHDFREGGDLTLGVLAVTADLGEIVSAEHFLFVSEHGDVTGEAMVLAGLPLTTGFTLEPRAELAWSAQNVPEEEYGSGVTDVSLSVRLRREIGPAVNVYLGATHERLVGETKRIALANGDKGQVNRLVIGAGLAF
jgi:copper resistance protein B